MPEFAPELKGVGALGVNEVVRDVPGPVSAPEVGGGTHAALVKAADAGGGRAGDIAPVSKPNDWGTRL